jgi:hypothetical protein
MLVNRIVYLPQGPVHLPQLPGEHHHHHPTPFTSLESM